MALTGTQRKTAQWLLKAFEDSGRRITNQDIEYISYRDFDKARTGALPELRRFLQRFLMRELDTAEFLGAL
jgi:hypothetical protein